jgi:hypothetical protein
MNVIDIHSNFSPIKEPSLSVRICSNCSELHSEKDLPKSWVTLEDKR